MAQSTEIKKIETYMDEWFPDGGWTRTKADKEVAREDRGTYKTIFYLTHEVHGRFDYAEDVDDNASLLVFRIEPKADDPTVQFLRFKVTLRCSKARSSDDAPYFSAADPALRGEQVLDTFVINRSKTFTTGASVNVQAPSAASGGANVSSTTADSYEVRQRHTISARIEKGSTRSTHRDCAWWELKAAPRAGQGIGDYLTVAVVVHRGKGQQVTLTADTEAELSSLSDKFRRLNPFHRKRDGSDLGNYGPMPSKAQVIPEGVNENCLNDSTDSQKAVRENLHVGVHLPEKEPPLTTSGKMLWLRI